MKSKEQMEIFRILYEILFCYVNVFISVVYLIAKHTKPGDFQTTTPQIERYRWKRKQDQGYQEIQTKKKSFCRISSDDPVDGIRVLFLLCKLFPVNRAASMSHKGKCASGRGISKRENKN